MFITPWHICSFSVVSFSDCDFLNWLCFSLMWFYLHLEIFPAAEWATHLGKMLWEEMKSMWESPEAFPHLEFSWFPGNCLVLCRTLQISVLVPGRTMSVPLLFQARECSVGFQQPPHRLYSLPVAESIGLGCWVLVTVWYWMHTLNSRNWDVVRATSTVIYFLVLCRAGLLSAVAPSVGVLLQILRCDFIWCKIHDVKNPPKLVCGLGWLDRGRGES